LPQPIFLPARNFVPRWRIIIIPGLTFWPSKILTPNLLAIESLPKLVAPLDFVFAIDIYVIKIYSIFQGLPAQAGPQDFIISSNFSFMFTFFWYRNNNFFLFKKTASFNYSLIIP